MELKLKDNSEQKEVNTTKIMDMETGDIVEELKYQNEVVKPIKISTTVNYNPSSSKNNVNIYKIIISFILVLAVVAIVGSLMDKNKTSKVDLTNYVNKESGYVARELGLSFELDNEMAAKINHYSTGSVTVEGNGDVGVVYIDGKYSGLHTDKKGYSLYNISIGDPIIAVDNKTTYKYDDCFQVLDDIAAGDSEAYYYYNLTQGDCFVVIVNNHSNKVVAMTYFSDYYKVTETLDSLE